MVINLSYPPAGLNPNKTKGRHWGPIHKLKKSYQDVIGWEAIGHRPALPPEGDIKLIITFHPPDHRHRDDDNAIGGFKYARDTLAKLWGVNDRRFRPVYQWGNVIKGGRVTVEVCST